jgi:predicted  nucleic acid-binding Zn-ribbon protein
MASTIIQDILTNGKAINNELGKKIESLNKTNSNFNTVLTNKLKDIINAIDKFKNTNLQGLNETKNKLEAVTKELQTTRDNLQQTQTELDSVKNSLNECQNALQEANARKTELEQRERELNNRLSQLETEYNNKIAGIRDEMAKKSAEEKKAMQQEFDNQLANLNAEKEQLRKEMQDAQNAQTAATNQLSALQKEQEGLINNLATVNSFLTQQLELITRINTNQPNIDEYNGLLDTIQNGLGGVITQINQAVAGPSAVYPTPLYDKYVNLTPEQKDEILNVLPVEYKNEIRKNPNDKANIQNILSKYYKGNVLRGGKRKTRRMKGRKGRKTMKKRHMKTKKHLRRQKGGYVYSSSKELDSASLKSSSNKFTRSKRHSKSRKTSL